MSSIVVRYIIIVLKCFKTIKCGQYTCKIMVRKMHPKWDVFIATTHVVLRKGLYLWALRREQKLKSFWTIFFTRFLYFRAASDREHDDNVMYLVVRLWTTCTVHLTFKVLIIDCNRRRFFFIYKHKFVRKSQNAIKLFSEFFLRKEPPPFLKQLLF